MVKGFAGPPITYEGTHGYTDVSEDGEVTLRYSISGNNVPQGRAFGYERKFISFDGGLYDKKRLDNLTDPSKYVDKHGYELSDRELERRTDPNAEVWYSD